jgi:hypothetical protein
MIEFRFVYSNFLAPVEAISFFFFVNIKIGYKKEKDKADDGISFL